MLSLSEYIALARDAFIVGALGFVCWWIHNSGEDHVRVKDMQAVQKQLTANADNEARNAQDAAAAEVQHEQDLQDIGARIANQRAPVFMCPRSPNTSTVSAHPTAAQGAAGPASGAADAGPGVDIRGAVNAFEDKYERALADCRQALASWPR